MYFVSTDCSLTSQLLPLKHLLLKYPMVTVDLMSDHQIYQDVIGIMLPLFINKKLTELVLQSMQPSLA